MTQRITIRDDVLNNLKILSGYNVPSAGTTEGIEREKLPAIFVGFATEQAEQELSGTTRQLDLVVSVVVHSRGDIYELLDQASEDVEGVLQDRTLGGTCEIFALSQTGFALDQDHPLGEVRLTYTAQYSTE
ncbi:hypothetical protein ACJJIC_15765 [Microbulbifer sp. ANSA002]|uniref:hypothetical protein n=1 Tax=unclassified Microbulbifer TaxID=2619833 RepID=UPI004041D9D2